MKTLPVRGRAADVFAKNISSTRFLLHDQLLAFAKGESLHPDSDAFVSEYVALLQTLNYNDDITRKSFILELSLMVLDEFIPLWCSVQWFEQLLLTHMVILQGLKSDWSEELFLYYIGKEPYTFYKKLLFRLKYVKKNFRHAVINESGWVYLAIDLMKDDPAIPEKMRFYYFYDEFLDVLIVKKIQNLSRRKFTFFQKVVMSIPRDTLYPEWIEAIASTVFKIKKRYCLSQEYAVSIPFLTQVLPVLISKFNCQKQMLKVCFDFWESMEMDVDEFIQKLKFLPIYFLTYLERRKKACFKNDDELFLHLFNGMNVRSFNPKDLYFSKKMAHFFYNYYELEFSPFSDVYEKSVYWTLLGSFQLKNLFEQYRFSPRYCVGSDNSEAIYIKFKNFLLKVDSWNLYTWDRAEIRQVLGYITHGYRDVEGFDISGFTAISIRRRSREYYEELRMVFRSKIRKEVKWNGAPYAGMQFKYQSQVVYKICQLTSSKELLEEGRLLHHCVGGYTQKCVSGRSSIWSLRMKNGEEWIPKVTIELSRDNRILQAKTKYNAKPASYLMDMIKQWVIDKVENQGK